MSLRHALLGVLAEAPMSGYDLNKRFEHSLQRVWFVRSNQVYMELKTLLADGAIELTDYGPRGRKIYAITENGLEEAKAWLRDGPDDAARSMRFDPLLRLNFMWILDPDDATAILDREAAYYRAQADEIRALATTLPDEDADGSIAARRAVGEIGVGVYEAMARGAEKLGQALKRSAAAEKRERKPR